MGSFATKPTYNVAPSYTRKQQYIQQQQQQQQQQPQSPLEKTIRAWISLNNPKELLDLSYMGLMDFDGSILPSTCQRLALYNNHLSKLPTPLPPNLKELFADNNPIKYVDGQALPQSLEILILTRTFITALPSPLPPKLRHMYASNCKLKSLPTTFPSTLENLSVHNNYITSIPETFPDSMRIFYASFNEIHRIPDRLPPFLEDMVISGNHFLIRQTEADEKGLAIYKYIVKVQEAQKTADEMESRCRVQERTQQLKEDLISVIYHPDRVSQWFQEGVLFQMVSDYDTQGSIQAQQQWTDCRT
jgi:Leucine-rich repeat (LRR) protein